MSKLPVILPEKAVTLIRETGELLAEAEAMLKLGYDPDLLGRQCTELGEAMLRVAREAQMVADEEYAAAWAAWKQD